jgi:hypothetical protein
VRIDLPGDGWAELREPSDLRAKDKIAVQRAVVFSLLGNQENGEETRIPVSAGMSDDMCIALLCRLVTAWSLSETLPPTPEILEDLPVTVYNALCEGIEPHLDLIRTVPKRKTHTGSSGSSKARR